MSCCSFILSPTPDSPSSLQINNTRHSNLGCEVVKRISVIVIQTEYLMLYFAVVERERWDSFTQQAQCFHACFSVLSFLMLSSPLADSDIGPWPTSASKRTPFLSGMPIPPPSSSSSISLTPSNTSTTSSRTPASGGNEKSAVSSGDQDEDEIDGKGFCCLFQFYCLSKVICQEIIFSNLSGVQEEVQRVMYVYRLYFSMSLLHNSGSFEYQK